MGKPRLVLRSTGSTFNPAMAEKYGNNWGKAKLTDEIVNEIRRRYKAGAVTVKELGRDYGISHQHVCKIIRGLVWKAIDEQA